MPSTFSGVEYVSVLPATLPPQKGSVPVNCTVSSGPMAEKASPAVSRVVPFGPSGPGWQAASGRARAAARRSGRVIRPAYTRRPAIASARNLLLCRNRCGCGGLFGWIAITKRDITMKLATYAALPFALAALAACDSQAEREADRVEDQVEQQAEASAVAAGNAVAALGLTEAQLLEADLVAADGTDLGDVEQVRRDSAGAVEGLLVEVEDSNPDRYVVVP